jgi:hypothetical protein
MSAQMSYKPSLKTKVPNLSAELRNVDEQVAAAFMGAKWPTKAKATSKSIKSTARMHFNVPGKSLRYGSSLMPDDDGFAVTWTRDGGTLKLSGKYRMY